MIKVVVDSTSYIPQEYLNNYDISVISMNIVSNNVSEREVEVDQVQFYENLKNMNGLPTSSQPILEEVYDTFERIVANGDEVFGIFLSSEMSGTYSSAHLVKEMILEKYPNASIELFDSRTNCMQEGFIAIEVAKAGMELKSMEEARIIAETTLENSRFLFTPDNLEYLRRGGRIGNASALLGNILQIKPILTVEDGKTTIYTKVRTKKKAVETIINSFLEDIKGFELGDVIVHHINCVEEGLEIANKLKELLNREVLISTIGPVIGLHVGPNSVGVAYFKK